MTKAVIAKGKKRTEQDVVLKPPNRPTSILGCWVINHTHQAKKHGKYIEVTGKFDVNVWYSHNDHSKTAVFTESVPYKDQIRLNYRDEPTSGQEDILVTVLQHPNCTKATISDCGEKFNICVERELLAEVVGETKVLISVHPHGHFEEQWPFKDESSSHEDVRGHHEDDHKKGKDSSSL
ncbi:spore coat protein e [Bacillus sp. OxB-1]|uniref:outer spore coat protein CotE n=1 Tax=Bacillus sp. (strain OxB-1) TaxID=98228 RepID=UPI0005820985|nr:outer spore coat protein CotE [Bacillus sp. OxB-1]BAQ10594.1 spore coat protein e [Bacillus sp. OxB-1]